MAVVLEEAVLVSDCVEVALDVLVEVPETVFVAVLVDVRVDV